MSKFQLIIISIIIGLVFVAFLVLSGAIPGLPGGSGGSAVKLTMWGTFPKERLYDFLREVNEKYREDFSLTYVEKEKDSYEEELIDALASGKGPDVWLLTQDLILKHKDKSYKISFDTLKERTFRDTFIDEAGLFLEGGERGGILAIPFIVDPIVLYWNKDLFNKAGLARPSKSWAEFLNQARDLTEKDAAGNIVQSGAALGEFDNIRNAKDIFSMLILQSGNKIVNPISLEMEFGQKGNLTIDPVSSALTFYASFSNPSKVSYSWNRALPDSREYFISGKLGAYLGYAGEYGDIKQANPHLNFDVASAPQMEDAATYAAFGKMYGLAISRQTQNPSAILNAIFQMASKDSLEILTENIFLAPVARSMLVEEPADPAMAVFYKAAVQSTAWLEPDPKKVSDIFKNMIESVVTGKKSISTAVRDGRTLLQAELEQVTSNK